MTDLDSGLEEIRKIVEQATPGEWLFFAVPTTRY